MSDKYTINNVTEDLGRLLTLTKVFEMDKDGFWYDAKAEKRVQYGVGDDSSDTKEIVVSQDPLPKGDYHVFNPFAEGFGKKSAAVQMFYKAIRVALNVNLRQVVTYVAKEVLASKEDENTRLSPAVVRMSSVKIGKREVLFDVVDDKLVDEFEKIFDRIGEDCIFVPYLNQQMTARVKIDALTDDKWDDKYGKDIRKKTLSAFKSTLMGVLGLKDVKDIQDLSVKYDPDLKSSARLDCTIRVYLKLYSRFNDVLGEAWNSDEDVIDLDMLNQVIDNFPLAYAIAKHMIQPSLPKNKVTDTNTVDTRKMGFSNDSGHRRFPGPEMVDEFGRHVKPGVQPISVGMTPPSHGRFAPNVIGEVHTDAFAPMVRSANTLGSGSSFGGGTNIPINYVGNQSSSGGYFGNQGMNLNTTPPSNFGSPNTRRTYF